MQLDYHTFITFLKDSNVEKEFRHNFFVNNGGVTFWRKIDNPFQRKFC